MALFAAAAAPPRCSDSQFENTKRFGQKKFTLLRFKDLVCARNFGGLIPKFARVAGEEQGVRAEELDGSKIPLHSCEMPMRDMRGKELIVVNALRFSIWVIELEHQSRFRASSASQTGNLLDHIRKTMPRLFDSFVNHVPENMV